MLKSVRVLNIGIDAVVAGSRGHATVESLHWQPPHDGDPRTARQVASLLIDSQINVANQHAVAAALAIDPIVTGVAQASDAIEALGSGERRLLHAGPPIPWEAMCGPMRGALIGATLAEKWAVTPDAADALLASGTIALEPCHHHQAVGPMAGVISPSMPVWTVVDEITGSVAYSTLNEGLGQVLRFGAYSEVVLDRLSWMAIELGPAVHRAVQALGGIGLQSIMAQSLTMGDELHNRNAAATGQLLKRLASSLVSANMDSGAASRVLGFIGSNDHFFLNLSMAACKLKMDAAAGFGNSTIVTAMCRNGVDFGIRMSAAGDRWFTAPAAMIDGLYFPGYGPSDANPDLGDSAITETAGLGGFAMGAAPAIVGFVGGTPQDALAHSVSMRDITVSQDPVFTIPSLGFAGTAFGIDARAVVDSGLTPVINTGIAHRNAGVGQIGAGITHAPWECFRDAVAWMANEATG
jgi:hypothetical protein